MERCRTPQLLAQHGLPNSASYYAMRWRSSLLLVLWSPELSYTKDAAKASFQVAESAKYAVLRQSVEDIVLEAFGDTQPSVVRIEAHEPNDITDAAQAALSACKEVP